MVSVKPGDEVAVRTSRGWCWAEVESINKRTVKAWLLATGRSGGVFRLALVKRKHSQVRGLLNKGIR